MTQQEAPRSIDVALPHVSEHGGEFPTAMETRLFRTECDLPAPLKEVIARNENESEIYATSAGCSIGAEVYGIIALLRKFGFGGGVNVVGLDNSPEALARARTAHFWLLRLTDEEEEIKEVRTTLTEYGFRLDTDTIYPHTEVNSKRPDLGEFGYHRIDATPLRQGSAITFIDCDLSGGVPIVPPANFVAVNNLLYHQEPERASRIMKHLVHEDVLAENGVVSWGNTWGDDPRSRRMRYRSDGTTMTRYDWVQRTTELLNREFGLEPIGTPSPAGLPTMFAKT